MLKLFGPRHSACRGLVVMASLTRDRKRKAVSELRDLAAELGLAVNRRLPDLTEVAFTATHAQVVEACRTDAQRQRATALVAAFKGEGAPRLPALAGCGGQQPQGQGLALAAPPGAPGQPAQEERCAQIQINGKIWNPHPHGLFLTSVFDGC